MLKSALVLSPAAVVEVVVAFVSAFGALLIWNLPRYRALAHYFIYQSLLMLLNLHEASGTGLLITPVFTLLKGPLLYLFVRALVNEKRLQGLPLYVQFLPPLVLILLRLDVQATVLLGTVSQIIYLALSFRLLQRYGSVARDFRSDADAQQLTWLRGACALIALQAVIGLIRLNLQPGLSATVLSNWFAFDLLFLLGISCLLLFKAVRQPTLYDGLLAYEGARTARPARDGGHDSEAKSVFARLDALIVQGQLFKRPRFSVEDLAEETGMQMKDISWAFNAGAGTGFNDYINRLRVEALRQQLDGSPLQQSLLEMALATGFNSKSSFNASFKRETGMTPSQYIRKAAAQRLGSHVTDG